MNYAGFTKKFFEIVIVTLHPLGCCSTIKLRFALVECLPLCCLTSLSSHCSVFKVHSFQPLLKPDLKIQIPLGFEIQQQILSGGPEWARTTDLTIISRTL